jgi:predicted GNAT superfamily acetyltransferase
MVDVARAISVMVIFMSGVRDQADARIGDTGCVPLIQHETFLFIVRIVLLAQHAQGGGLAIRRHLESVLTEADQVSPHCHSLHSATL